MYNKKAEESFNKGKEAAEEPIGSLAVSMPLEEFNQTTTQRVFLSIGLLKTL